MNSSIKTLTVIAAVCFSLASAAQTTNKGWQNLFNGKNLDGWKQLNGKAKYEVKNGEIIGTTVAGEPNSFLSTTKNYGDFILELELLVDNSMIPEYSSEV